MSFSLLLVLAALLAVLATLVIGLFAMARGRESDAGLSQKMMRWRVILQAVALACFVLAVLTHGKT